MSRYSRQIEITFPLSRESGRWEHDTLPMPACLAGWLDANVFGGCVDVFVSFTVRGKFTGFDGDDEHEFICHGATVEWTPIPAHILNCALSGEWEDHFAKELMDARQSACVAI